jgi:hypothetical protein
VKLKDHSEKKTTVVSQLLLAKIAIRSRLLATEARRNKMSWQGAKDLSPLPALISILKLGYLAFITAPRNTKIVNAI